MLTSNVDPVSRAYLDPSAPGSYGSTKKFAHELRRKGVKVKGSTVDNVLAESNLYRRGVKRKGVFTRKVLSFAPGDQWQADLVDFQGLSRHNRNYKYILVAVDCFSRKAYTEPVLTKHGAVVAKALEVLFSRSERGPPRKLQTDNGKEFYNHYVKEMLDNHNVQLFSTFTPETKAVMAERFNLTIQKKLYAYMQINTTHNWIDVLPAMTESYNKTSHQSLGGLAPDDVTDENMHMVRQFIYEKKPPQPPKNPRLKPKFEEGDLVHISKQRGVFHRGYQRYFTTETFKVSKVKWDAWGRYIYLLRDKHGEDIQGTFMEGELLAAAKNSQDKTLRQMGFDVDVLSKTRRKALVDYKGWPKKYKNWVELERI